MATIDRQSAIQQQRKVNQQVARASRGSKQADPARLAAIAAASQMERVRVLPKNELIRKFLKHEPTKIRFRAEGSIDWPFDKFTQRRLRDGDITVETQDVALERPKRGTSAS